MESITHLLHIIYRIEKLKCSIKIQKATNFFEKKSKLIVYNLPDILISCSKKSLQNRREFSRNVGRHVVSADIDHLHGVKPNNVHLGMNWNRLYI